jgi:hypothetical protein
MSRSDLAWLAVGAYALHVLEEHILGWHGWAKKTMKLTMEWDTYTTVEIVILILGAISAVLFSSQPILALAFAALLVINVTFFHLLPMLVTGGKFSPGVITGFFLFYPVGFLQYQASAPTQNMLLWSVAIGAAVILFPVLLLKLRSKAYFRPSR